MEFVEKIDTHQPMKSMEKLSYVCLTCNYVKSENKPSVIQKVIDNQVMINQVLIKKVIDNQVVNSQVMINQVFIQKVIDNQVVNSQVMINQVLIKKVIVNPNPDGSGRLDCLEEWRRL